MVVHLICTIHHGIVWKHVHKGRRDIPSVNVVPECSLKMISGIEEDRIRSLAHKLFRRCVNSRQASDTFIYGFFRTRTSCRTDLLESRGNKMFVIFVKMCPARAFLSKSIINTSGEAERRFNISKGVSSHTIRLNLTVTSPGFN